MGNCFHRYFRRLFIPLALTKCEKRDCKILLTVKIIPVPDFCSIFYRIQLSHAVFSQLS